MGRVTPTAPESAPVAFRGTRGQVLVMALAALATAPGVVSRLGDLDLGNLVAPVVFGVAILGSAVLLAWADEASQLDVSQGLALTLVDSVVLIAIFACFVLRLWRAPAEEPQLVGAARLIASLPAAQRRVVVGAVLAYAATVMFLCAAPFAETLVHLGEQAGIST